MTQLGHFIDIPSKAIGFNSVLGGQGYTGTVLTKRLRPYPL